MRPDQEIVERRKEYDGIIEQFGAFVADLGAWLWGIPLLIIFLFCYLFISASTGFVQFRHLAHICKNTFGEMFGRKKGEGTIRPFSAAMTALAQSVGASNIVGVPLAIAIGGPGALFWLWVACLLGMGMRYAEIAIAVKYREKNANGEWVGGPQMYMKKGLRAGALAMVWSVAYVLVVLLSVPAQTASVVENASTVGVPGWLVAGIMFIATALVIFGGIKRIAKITDILVPFMALFYFLTAWIIIFSHGNALGSSLALVFQSAFAPAAAVGGFAGSGVIMAIRQGVARGIYSFGAGMGDFTIAHAAAITDHPCRQAQWGVFEMICSFVICTTSGLLALTTGLWTVGESAAGTIPSLAFAEFYPGNLGPILLSISLFLFAYSTILVAIHYGRKQAEYVGGQKLSQIMGVVYLLCIPFGAVATMGYFLNFVDIMLAFVVFTNIISVTLMWKQIRALVADYFGNPNFYPRRKKFRNENG
ncbi:MAG TPA: amino acid carrier protein [Firmicutes bacterium]|nr:amino acid carrier protein [Bacillota bacterium]